MKKILLCSSLLCVKTLYGMDCDYFPYKEEVCFNNRYECISEPEEHGVEEKQKLFDVFPDPNGLKTDWVKIFKDNCQSMPCDGIFDKNETGFFSFLKVDLLRKLKMLFHSVWLSEFVES